MENKIKGNEEEQQEELKKETLQKVLQSLTKDQKKEVVDTMLRGKGVFEESSKVFMAYEGGRVWGVFRKKIFDKNHELIETIYEKILNE